MQQGVSNPSVESIATAPKIGSARRHSSAVVARLLGALVAAGVLAAVLLVVHDFYTRVDRAVYLAADDSLANISYTLATEGRYGFLTSPVLVGKPRHVGGQFNYGPWYF